MNYNNKLSELLQDVQTWSELKVKLEEFNTSKTETTTKTTIAGKLFEYFAKCYFLVEPEQELLYSNVWLYDEIPSEIKSKLNFPDNDFGIDLLLKDKQERFIAVQCKFKNDEEYILKWSKDKIANPFALAEKCDSVLIFTNAADCVEEAKQREKFNLIDIGTLISTSAEVLSSIKLYCDEKKIAPLKKHDRFPHQVEAVKAVVDYFNNTKGKYPDRAQLILPCGAGKTLAALWVKEDLPSKNTLVLFPSLALLRQFKTEWANQRRQDYIYLNVCSEKDIDKSTDDITITHTYEISGEVTTSPERIREFLFASDESKIVFSTYQSIKVIETALQFLPDFSFDLIICDEAHRTAGARANTFAIVHDQKRIRGKKRLYMTATPKVASKKLQEKREDINEFIYDMSFPEDFGEEAYRMSFAKAIPKVLVDYKIIGIGVTHKQVKQFIDERRFVNQNTDLKEVADNFALDLVMKKYNANHALTFHSYVATAREFSERHHSYFSPDVFAQYVSGEHLTSKRAKILKEFKEHPKGVVSNARCLREGVDVPTIDMIFFCDPKNSKVDIVQASGRALRKDPSGKKTMGYIVVPIYHHIDEDIEKEIEKKPYFQNLIQIIRSLCDHDERLRVEIDDIAFGKGEKTSRRIEITYDDSVIEKIIKLEGLDKKVRDFLFDQIIDKTKNNWNVRFRELKAFKKKYNTTDVSRKHNNELLRWWTQEQRDAYHGKKIHKLNSEKIKKLESIGFDWKGKQRLSYLPPDEKWKKNYEKLKKYFDEVGDVDIPARYEKDKPLATWVVTQRVRYDTGRLSEEQIDLLEDLNIDWDPRNVFEEKIRLFKAYKEKHGDLLISQTDKPYIKEARWVNKFRMIYNRGSVNAKGTRYLKHLGSIRQNEIDVLNSIGFVWYAGTMEWDERFQQVKEYWEVNKTSHVKLSDNITLFYWCYRQRNRIDKLEPEQIEKLKSIDFVFDTSEFEKPDDFLDRMIDLQKHFEDNRNFEIPDSKPKLKSWLASVRKAYKQGELDETKIELLKGIGFTETNFNPTEEKWKAKLKELKAFFDKNKTFVIPNFEENYYLRYWVKLQIKAFKENTLSKEKKELLESIGFSFLENYFSIKFRQKSGFDKNWKERLTELQSYFDKKKTFHIHVSSDTEQESLRLWLQRIKREQKTGLLKVERENELKAMGLDFQPREKKGRKPKDYAWEKRVTELKNYFDQYKTFRIAADTAENLSLRIWLNGIKRKHEQNLLTPTRIEKLQSIGFDFNTKYKSHIKNPIDPRWKLKVDELKKHFDETQSFFISPDNLEKVKLKQWINQQRVLFNHEQLSDEKQEMLEEIGYSFTEQYFIRKGRSVDSETYNAKWDSMFEKAKNYSEQKKTFHIPIGDKENKQLRVWLLTQRSYFREKSLSKDREEKLLAIGYDFEKKFKGAGQGRKRKNISNPVKAKSKVSNWDENFLKLVNYKLENGDCNVGKSHSDKLFYYWVIKQRNRKRKKLLSPEQIKKLDLLGFHWGEKELQSTLDVWLKTYERMKQFYDIHKHTKLTVKNSDKQMRSWATMQRHRKRNDDLKPEYVTLLDNINFDWEPDNKGSIPDEERWMERFQELVEFKEKFNTTNVSQTNKEYYKLSRWVLEQRRYLTKKELSDLRKQKLDSIGFIWNARKGKAKANA